MDQMIGKWMTPNPIRVAPEMDLYRTLVLMMEAKVRRLPVENNGRLVGIITEKDIKEKCVGTLTHLKLAEVQDLLMHVKVGGVMSLEPVVATPGDSLIEAARRMEERRIGGLPVVEEGRLVGMVTRSDVLRGLLSQTESGGPGGETRDSGKHRGL
jgi:CBS domain-containing protein